jgi:rhomboid family GlyGly-CTERM serine protease
MSDVFAAMSELLQYDRQAIADGELWRFVTGHAVHFGFEHFVWDAAVFAVLALLCWRLGPRRCLVSLAAATLAIPAVLWTVQPGLETYRGLSGLDSALYVTGALALGQRLWAEGRRSLGIAALASVAALAAKVAYELATGQTLFVDAARVGFAPVPLAHVTGALAGLLASFPVRFDDMAPRL